MRDTAFAIAFSLLVTTSVLGAPSKQPWQLSVDERFANRFQHAEQSRRAADHAARQQSRGRSVHGNFVDVIDGKVHSELYLPTELFRKFVLNGFTEGSDGFRAAFIRQSDDVLITTQEWRAVEPLVSEYLGTLTREAELLERLENAAAPDRLPLEHELQKLRSGQCRVAVDSLDRVREYFTGERFDRFLYTVVAPTLTTFVTASPTDEEVATLRRMEGGCR